MPRLLHHISVRYPCIPTSGKKSGFLDVFYG